MQKSRINAAPRLLPPGRILGFVAIVLCACQGTDTIHSEDPSSGILDDAEFLPCDENDLYKQGTEVEVFGLSAANDDLNGSLAKVLGKDPEVPTRYIVKIIRWQPTSPVDSELNVIRAPPSIWDHVNPYSPHFYFSKNSPAVSAQRGGKQYDPDELVSLNMENLRQPKEHPASGDSVNRFRSALEVPDLTAMILQYGMYDREARRVLTADPTLVHLYNDHAGGFKQPAGVEVTGAGYAQVNGWYYRKEASEGPPRSWPNQWDWSYVNAGRPWYEKDGGCYIHRSEWTSSWRICNPDGVSRYTYKVPPGSDDGGHGPPASGSRSWRVSLHGTAPAPTLRVVGH